MMINPERIPDLMKFVPTHSYFQIDHPLQYEFPKKIDKITQGLSKK